MVKNAPSLHRSASNLTLRPVPPTPIISTPALSRAEPEITQARKSMGQEVKSGSSRASGLPSFSVEAGLDVVKPNLESQEDSRVESLSSLPRGNVTAKLLARLSQLESAVGAANMKMTRRTVEALLKTGSARSLERAGAFLDDIDECILRENLGDTPLASEYGAADERDVPESLIEAYHRTIDEHRQKSQQSLITEAFGGGDALKAPEAYTQPFCDFMTENPTVFHAVDHFEKKLEKAGFKKLSERKTWSLEAGGKYFVSRNASSLIAFSVGGGYKGGNGVAMVAGHIDALTARLKPVSNKKTSAGYVQLGVAPYAGGLNTTWWDRDLGIGGKVLVKDSSTGKISTKLVKLGWPIARIPTLAPHFGVGMLGQNNAETQAVPIIGLDNSDIGATEEFQNITLGAAGTFTATQPPKLVKCIANELSIQDYSTIVNWELELFDIQAAQTGGLEKEFIFAGRIDDKVCSWAAIEGLLASVSGPSSKDDGIVKLVGLFDDEEIGSLLRQGARGNFLPGTVERISESFSENGSSANVLSQTYANSFLISADVTHAVNPNFLGSYLENHAPRLNVGLTIAADSNGHMTTDSASTALLTRIAEKCGSKLQVFMIRNDSRSGGTVGPVLSSAMGVRAIDAGIPQLSMHSVRATIGSLDPGLGVKIFKGFFDEFESVDAEFE